MAILLALSANLVFSFASTLFTDFSRQVSAKWINCLKLTVAFVCFWVMAVLVRDPLVLSTLPVFVFSGAVGLFVADHFLCEAFSKIGAARTLMIFSFAPLFVAFWCFLFFDERLDFQKFVAILFFIACVMTISFERLKKEGSWEVVGLLFAFSGVVLDGLANVITSYGFRAAPENGVFSVCALRATGAFLAFLLLTPFIKVRLVGHFKKLSSRDKWIVLLAAFVGTFLSLTLWISAVKMGNLTTLVALSGITPLFAAIFEIARGKTKLSKYLLISFIFYAVGFYFLVIRS
jgi:drug/metabolite transporter (DMT)-like permease